MLENPFRPLCVEAREQIAQWLASHGMPYPEPEQRFQFTTKDGARGEGTIETYAAMMRGTDFVSILQRRRSN